MIINNWYGLYLKPRLETVLCLSILHPHSAQTSDSALNLNLKLLNSLKLRDIAKKGTPFTKNKMFPNHCCYFMGENIYEPNPWRKLTWDDNITIFTFQFNIVFYLSLYIIEGEKSALKQFLTIFHITLWLLGFKKIETMSQSIQISCPNAFHCHL